jgi:hypothetical protein
MTNEKSPREMAEQMRRVFGTQEGEEVLSWILEDTGCFTKVSEDAVGTRNYGVRLLQLMGVYRPETTLDITRAMLEIPLPAQED